MPKNKGEKGQFQSTGGTKKEPPIEKAEVLTYQELNINKKDASKWQNMAKYEKEIMTEVDQCIEKNKPISKTRENKKQMKTAERYVGIKTVSRYTSLPVKTLYEWAGQGKMPSIKIGRRVLFDLQDIDRIMASLKRPCRQHEKTADKIIGDLHGNGI